MRTRQKNRHGESGVITIAETLIVIGVAIAILITWALHRNAQLTNETARQSGRVIAAYSRAAAEWLSEAPPATDGDYGIAELQDCMDPAGPRFLSCSLSPASSIPFAYGPADTPISLNDLVIRVALTPDGAAGDIDFGVIRSGEDANDDGIPDSRPDLAAIAHRTASEETGAGVNDFFELTFARTDPTGLIFDLTDPAFDQAAIDDLARLQARVGATVNAPFLRTDGSNEMQAGITFDNGVMVGPSGSNLEITGPGDVVVNTATGSLTATVVTAAELSATTALTVDPADGVRGAGFDRLDQSREVADNRRTIRSNQTSIATNESSINSNASRITSNRNRITTNEGRITSNRNRITTNEGRITSNEGRIASNEGSITSNRNRITSNTSGVTANRNRIASNESDISALQNTSPPPPTQCVPTEATVRASLPSGTVFSQPSGCFGCGTWRYTTRSHTYYVRNLTTLNCESRTLSSYSNICLDSNGNCDGYCDHGVTKC